MIGIRKLLSKFYNQYFRLDPLIELKKRGLIVGKNFNMLSGVIIGTSHCWHITIGDNVTLAPRVIILAHDASTKIHLNYTKIGKVNIGNRVFIGASSIILPGVSIGNDVVIGASSVVSHNIPDGVVAAGNPAKILGPIEAFLSRKRKEMDHFPCFSDEYTLRKNITDEMKCEMNKKMKDRYGYVI
jgi:maltose O-acetyltransferase